MDGRITGYASLFGVPDLGRDVVQAGAFSASLRARGAAGIRMLFQHDPAEPVGRWTSLTEDSRGLAVTGELNLAVARARDLAALVAEGGLDGLSIGFRTLAARPDGRGARRLIRVDLWEVSLVTFPLQPGARIARPTPEPSVSPARSLPEEIRGLARRIAPASARPLSRSSARSLALTGE